MADKSAGLKKDATRDMVSSLSHSLQRSWPSDKNVLQSAAKEVEARKMDINQQEKRSLSGLLRKASMLCKPGGGVDPSHKALMKSLVLDQDETIVAALDSSEQGQAGDLNKYLQLLSVDSDALSAEQKSAVGRERKAMVEQWQKNIKTLARKIVKKDDAGGNLGAPAAAGSGGMPGLNAAQSEFERRRIEQGLGSKRSRPGSMMGLTKFRDPLRLRTVTEKGAEEEAADDEEDDDDESEDDEPVMRVDNPARLLVPKHSDRQQKSTPNSFQLGAQQQQQQQQPGHAQKRSSAPSASNPMSAMPPPQTNGVDAGNNSALLAKLLQLQNDANPNGQQQQQQHMQHQQNQQSKHGNGLGLAALGNLASVAASSTGSSSPTTPNAASPEASGSPSNAVLNIMLLMQQQRDALQEKQHHELERLMQSVHDRSMEPQTLMQLFEMTKTRHEQETRDQNDQLAALFQSSGAGALGATSPGQDAAVRLGLLNNLFGNNMGSQSMSSSSPGMGVGHNGATNGDFGAGIGVSSAASSSGSPASGYPPNALSTLLSRYAASNAGFSGSTSPFGGSTASGGSNNNFSNVGDAASGPYGHFGAGVHGGASGPAISPSSLGMDQRMLLRRLLAEQHQHNGAQDLSGFLPRNFVPGQLATLADFGIVDDSVSTTGSAVADLVLSRQREREARKQVKLEVRREKKSSRERQRRFVLNTKYDELCALLFDPVERESKDRASVLQTAINFIHDTDGVPVPDHVPGEDEIDDDDDDDVNTLPAGPNLSTEEKALRRRLKKSRREKQRRHNVNILSERLGTMLAVPEIKEKALVLQTAIQRIADKKGIKLPESS